MTGTPPAAMALPLWFDVTAMAINSVFGAAVARSRLEPIYGILLGGILVGLGGGMARDILLGLEPAAISRWIYIAAALAGSIVGGLFFGPFVTKPRPFLLLNGVTLGFLVTVGAQRAIAHGAPMTSAIFLGVITASFGGAVSDLLAGRRAAIVSQDHWLASALVAGAIAFVILSVLVNFWVAVAVGVTVVTVLQYLSKQRNWSSPSWPGESRTQGAA